MATQDEDVVTEFVIEYYRWLSGNGGLSSDDLLSLPLPAAQRRLLLERMDDVNVVFALTALPSPSRH
jgi:hypothetical protein